MLTNNHLRKIILTPVRSDADAGVAAMARELMALRRENAELRQAFVPLHADALGERVAPLCEDFNALCIKHRTAAAIVVPHTGEDGTLLLHVAGESKTALLVRAMMPAVEGE